MQTFVYVSGEEHDKKTFKYEECNRKRLFFCVDLNADSFQNNSRAKSSDTGFQ